MKSGRPQEPVTLDARIAFRLSRPLMDKLLIWADEEDRTVSNLVMAIVKRAVAERERMRGSNESPEP